MAETFWKKDLGVREYDYRFTKLKAIKFDHRINIVFGFRNRQIESMEWLLENSHRVKEIDIEEPKFQSELQQDNDNPVKKIQRLLEDIRIFHHRYFESNKKVMENLLEMGFSHDDVDEALRITDNNQLAAVCIIFPLTVIRGHILYLQRPIHYLLGY